MPAFTFGPFRLDTTAYRLTRDGEVVDTSPRQLDLLAYFTSHPTQLVTREELFQALWPDVTVTDNALTQLVSELRHTLGDPSASPRYALAANREQARAHLGLARLASAAGGQVADVVAPHLDRARDAITQLRRGGRTAEADLMTAGTAAIENRTEDAAATLDRMLKDAPPGAAGWSLPIEPLLEGIRSAPAFSQVLNHLDRRAR